MSRGMGPRTLPRSIDPESPDGVYFGMDEKTVDRESPIPGGDIHLLNAPTVRQDVPVPASRPEIRGDLAHGVMPENHTTHERAWMEAHGTTNSVKSGQPPHYAPVEEGIPPVPVYLVEKHGGFRPLKTMATRIFTVPASGTTPIPIAARDLTRKNLKLLVETLAGTNGSAPTGVRVSRELAELASGRGILISAAANTYQDFPHSDVLFAVSNDASACTLSVVYLYEVAGAG